MILTLALILFFLIIEWLGRTNEYAIDKIGFNKPKFIRIIFYYILIIMIFLFAGNNQQFIYFQF